MVGIYTQRNSKPTGLSAVFGSELPVIGMIHLAGETHARTIDRAIAEIQTYRDEGINGIIVEDYEGSSDDLVECLKLLKTCPSLLGEMRLGVNLLQDPARGIQLSREYGGVFAQLDTVVGGRFDLARYRETAFKEPTVAILGGVGFKYVPKTGNSLEHDVAVAKGRCDVIVTTGPGTAQETSLKKLATYREAIGNFPFFVGAGVTAENAAEQLEHVDGMIVGSYFKRGNDTKNPVESERVRALMNEVRAARIRANL